VRTRASPTSAMEPGKRRMSAAETKERLVRASAWFGVFTTSISAGPGRRQGERAAMGGGRSLWHRRATRGEEAGEHGLLRSEGRRKSVMGQGSKQPFSKAHYKPRTVWRRRRVDGPVKLR
jgi:hypothetical protein